MWPAADRRRDGSEIIELDAQIHRDERRAQYYALARGAAEALGLAAAMAGDIDGRFFRREGGGGPIELGQGRTC